VLRFVENIGGKDASRRFALSALGEWIVYRIEFWKESTR